MQNLGIISYSCIFFVFFCRSWTYSRDHFLKRKVLNSIYLIFSIKVKIKSRDPFWNDFAVLSVLNTSKILDFTTLVNFSWVYRSLWRFQFDIPGIKRNIPLLPFHFEDRPLWPIKTVHFEPDFLGYTPFFSFDFKVGQKEA